MVGPSACPLTPTPASHHNCLVVFVSSSSSSSSLHLVAACLRLSSRALSHNTHTSHPCGFRVVSTRHPPSHTATHAPSLRSRCGSRSGGPRHILRLLLLLLPHPTRPLPSARGRPCSTPCTCLRRPCACLRRPCAGATGGGAGTHQAPPCLVFFVTNAFCLFDATPHCVGHPHHSSPLSLSTSHNHDLVVLCIEGLVWPLLLCHHPTPTRPLSLHPPPKKSHTND